MIEIFIGSDVDRDTLYAELRHRGDVWAEVVYDRERALYVVTFFDSDRDVTNGVDLREARQALLDAKDALVSRGLPDSPMA